MEIIPKELNYKIKMQWNGHNDILSPLKILAHSLMKKAKNINVNDALLCHPGSVRREGCCSAAKAECKWRQRLPTVALSREDCPLKPLPGYCLVPTVYFYPLAQLELFPCVFKCALKSCPF